MAGRTPERTWVGRIPYRLRDVWKKHIEETCRASAPEGQLIQVIKREHMGKLPGSLKITDCDYVASYSWMDSLTPTIIVPGTPPMWIPPPTDDEPPEYQSSLFHPLATEYPIYPMEPAARAAREQNPDFLTEKVDIFTSSDVLADLFRFTNGVDNDFHARFVMETVGDTVFIFRSEPQVQLAHDILGKIHTFREQYAVWQEDVRKSVSHQRIIRYKFGGLHILVHFEVDGYFDDSDPVPAAERQLDVHSSTNFIDNLFFDQLTSLSDHQSLEVVPKGKMVSQENIFAIHSCFATGIFNQNTRKNVDKTDIPALWVSQIPNLILGLHRRQAVGDFQIQNVEEVVAQWETENEDDLGRFASLLHQLVGSARAERTGLELSQNEQGQLEVRHESQNQEQTEDPDSMNDDPRRGSVGLGWNRVLAGIWVRDSIRNEDSRKSGKSDEKDDGRAEEAGSETDGVLCSHDDLERNREYTISPSDSGQDVDSEGPSLDSEHKLAIWATGHGSLD